MKLYEFMHDLQSRSHNQFGLDAEDNGSRSNVSVSIPGMNDSCTIDASDVASCKLGRMTLKKGPTIIELDADYDVNIQLGPGVVLQNIIFSRFKLIEGWKHTWGEICEKAERNNIWLANTQDMPAGMQVLEGATIPAEATSLSGDLELGYTESDDIFRFTQEARHRIARVCRFLPLEQLEAVLNNLP